ncbi:MAG: hypothetical protein R3F60_29805 [bacterium]
MSSHTDAFQDALARRRRRGVVIAACIVGAAVAAVAAFLLWPAPPAPAGADVALESMEGEGFTVGCPADWKGSGGKLAMCRAPEAVGAAVMCLVVPEPLTQALSPEGYWKQARRLSGMLMGETHQREARSYAVGDQPVHRIITEDISFGQAVHHLYYIYVPDKTAFVVTCSAPSVRFADLLPTFDTVAQSFRVK